MSDWKFYAIVIVGIALIIALVVVLVVWLFSKCPTGYVKISKE